MNSEPAKALTIAGSDSGGAAGLQADLRTFAALAVYGMSVVTTVTAQNSVSVNAVYPLPADFVAAQLDAVLADYGADAVKTGFIGRVDCIETVAAKFRQYRPRHVVIDPVLVNHRGETMFPAAVTTAYVEHLLPLASLVTPNRREATLLAGMPVESLADMQAAAGRIHALGPQFVLVKQGRDGNEVVDLLFDGAQATWLRQPWLDTTNTHGSGDTLSAAVTAYLACGQPMPAAVQKAQQFTAAAIKRGAAWRLGQGHGPVAQF